MPVRLAVAILVSCCTALHAAGCGSSLPEPDFVDPPPDAFVKVPYPPPAALAEVVPEEPSGDPVWIDGSWAWRGKSYVWQRGGWMLPVPGAGYVRPRVEYRKDGTTMFAEAAWYDQSGNKLEDPTVLAPATTPPNELTPEEQTAR